MGGKAMNCVNRSVCLAVGVLAINAGRAGAQGRIVVGPNIMVSAASPGREHGEYVADGHPTDPTRVMVCSQWFSHARNQQTAGTYVTFDGGRTWSLSVEDRSPRFTADPACAYGLDGQAFFAMLVVPDTLWTRIREHQWWRMGGDNNMPVYRSRDDGRTWGDTILLPYFDAQTVTVDRTTSPYRGRVYIYGNWSGGEPESGLWLIYSPDSGRTWLRSEFTRGTMHFPRAGTVLPTGTLILPYTTSIFGDGAIAVSTSTDGGVHLSRPVTVAQRQRAECTPTGSTLKTASDHSTGPFRGRAYVVWADLYRDSCSVYASYSDDEGKTWSAPVRVSDERPGPATTREGLEFGSTDLLRVRKHLMSQVAVSPSGVVGVTWYDVAEDTTQRGTKLRFTASLDGGESWLPSVPVSTHGYVIKHQPEFLARTVSEGGGARPSHWRPSGQRTGEVNIVARPAAPAVDYTGIAVGADGVFHAFWLDNRSGVGELYTARVTVDGSVAKPEADLAPLDNITSAIEVQFTSSVWDARTRTISWAYQLMNTTKDTIVGPVKMRITKLSSDLGAPTLVPDRGRSGGAGTTIDLSHALTGGRLLPGQTTPRQRLQVRVDDLRDTLGRGASDLVHMQVKVYGRRAASPRPQSEPSRRRGA